MKLYRFIAIAALATLAVACGQKKEKVDPEFKDLLPSKAQVDSVSYLLGINFGSTIKSYDFGDLNYSELMKGMKDFVNAKGEFSDSNFVKQFKINPETMNTFINGYLQKRNDYRVESSKAKSQRFLDKNQLEEGVQVTPSGLQYKILAAGSDLKPVDDKDTVLVNYTGRLIDGTVFDQSPEGEPVQFQLNRVIRGWTEGLKLIGEGGSAELYIPSDLAYGERGTQGIGPNAALIFNVELVEVHPYVEPVEAPAKGKKK